MSHPSFFQQKIQANPKNPLPASGTKAPGVKPTNAALKASASVNGWLVVVMAMDGWMD